MAGNNHAIVIGIDKYANSDFNLGGAVQDALDFARWAIESGGVPPENVMLLLSPLEGTQPARPAGVPAGNVLGAASEDILGVIDDYASGKAKKSKRLYIYYAGHGTSGPGTKDDTDRGLPDEPLLVPADLKDVKRNRKLFVGLSDFLRPLASVGPKEQIFFFDACRDFLLADFAFGIGVQVGPPISVNHGSSNQYILYATSVGKVAQQKGAGIFGQALLEGLRGGLGAAEQKTRTRPPYTSYYEVAFSNLVQYVSRRVTTRIEGQRPRGVITPGAPDVVLASIDEDDIPPLQLDVFVDPNEALQICGLEVSFRGPDGRSYPLKDGNRPPPTASPTTLKLPPYDRYFIKALAPDYRFDEKPWDITKPPRVKLRLKKAAARPRPPGDLQGLGGGAGGGRGIGFGEVPLSVTPAAGRLDVISEDPAALIGVWSANRQAIGMGMGQVILPGLPAGSYRVAMSLPEGGPPQERIIDVKPGETARIVLSSPAPQLGRSQLQMLNRLGIAPDTQGYTHPSEHLGSIASINLASLLGFAAFAAHWPNGDFQRLRSFGVVSMNNLPPGGSGLIVLIGASGDRLLKTRFLDTAEVFLFGPEGEALVQSNFSKLPGLEAGAQFSMPVEQKYKSVELRFTNSAFTRYPLASLPDRVSVLIVVGRDDGQFDVQQYILPLGNRPQMVEDLLTFSPSNIRRIEIAQRYYSQGKDLPQDPDVDGLLYGKWLDPLLGCLAGYSLIRAGQPERYVGTVEPESRWMPNNPGQSAMQNMLRFFPALPDSHVLAALCSPKGPERDAHFENALAAGVPVFSDGFRALYAWAKEREMVVPDALLGPARGLLPGSPWAAWSVARPVLLFTKGHFGTVPGGWETLEKKRKEIERAALSVGRLEVKGHPTYQWLGTAFLLARDIALVTRDSIAVLLEGDPAAWHLQPGVSLTVDFATNPDNAEADEFPVVELIGMGQKGDGSDSLAGDYALLRLPPTSVRGQPLPDPLKIAGQAPQAGEGRKVCVIGYPARDSRADPGLARAAFSDVYGVKRLQPGELIDIDAEKKQFHHDCFTLGGNAGSPVIDLETIQVLGLHIGGQANQKGYYKYNYALALWLLASEPLFRQARVRFAR